jgi:hypothetical protein
VIFDLLTGLSGVSRNTPIQMVANSKITATGQPDRVLRLGVSARFRASSA